MITIHDVKQHVVQPNNEDDLLLQGYLDAAIRFVELETHVPINVSTETAYFDEFEDCLILGPNVTAVTQVDYVDTDGVTQTLASNQYVLINTTTIARIEPEFEVTWPDTRDITDAVTVTYTVGYGTVPRLLEQAILMLVASWYEHREAITETQPGQTLREVPMAVQSILHKYRVHYV